ncbi:hypothetical protein HPULCUR_008163 [Helicostylum pulchrum]|uniref:F-box domain-containing protein n=1 Tax=Helicostylum pulchrum TaxID=562976 RepID=A0ABP9Y6T8_9FUNG
MESKRKPLQSIKVNQQNLPLQQVNVNKKPSRSLNKDKPVLSDPKSKPTVKTRRKKPPTTTTTTDELMPVKRKFPSKITIYIDPPKKSTTKPVLMIPNESDIFNLFGDEPPVYKLPADCLVTIFKLLKNTTTLSILSSVCRNWRKIAQQPFLWRDIICSQQDMNRVMTNLTTTQQFEHIRTLRIERDTGIQLTRDIALNTSPFTQLETLFLNHISLRDIGYITRWIKNVTSIHCRNIPVNRSEPQCLPDFSGMKKLNTLKLQFVKKCNLKLTYFTSVPNLKKLPTSLQTLEFINVYDDEEDIITPQDVVEATNFMIRHENISHWQRELPPIVIIDTWFKLEQILVLKYTMLSCLTNLTSLSLDRVSSFTSKVWIKCLLPCAPNLISVYFTGWSGNRESPSSIIKRNSNLNPRRAIPDIERALAVFVASLTSIKLLVLHNFVCSRGLIHGLNNLDREYTIQDEQQLEIDKLLLNFKITIKS